MPCKDVVRVKGSCHGNWVVFISSVNQRALPCEPDPLTLKWVWIHTCACRHMRLMHMRSLMQSHMYINQAVIYLNKPRKHSEEEYVILVSCIFSSTVTILASSLHRFVSPMFGLMTYICCCLSVPSVGHCWTLAHSLSHCSFILPFSFILPYNLRSVWSLSFLFQDMSLCICLIL